MKRALPGYRIWCAAESEIGAENASSRGAAVIDLLLEDLAGLEREHLALIYRDRVAGLRVTPAPGALLIHHKAAESRYLDLLAAPKALLNNAKDLLDQLPGLFLGGAYTFVNKSDQISFGH